MTRLEDLPLVWAVQRMLGLIRLSLTVPDRRAGLRDAVRDAFGPLVERAQAAALVWAARPDRDVAAVSLYVGSCSACVHLAAVLAGADPRAAREAAGHLARVLNGLAADAPEFRRSMQRLSPTLPAG